MSKIYYSVPSINYNQETDNGKFKNIKSSPAKLSSSPAKLSSNLSLSSAYGQYLPLSSKTSLSNPPNKPLPPIPIDKDLNTIKKDLDKILKFELYNDINESACATRKTYTY